MSDKLDLDILLNRIEVLERKVALLEHAQLEQVFSEQDNFNLNHKYDGKKGHANMIYNDFEVYASFQGITIKKYIGPERAEIHIPHMLDALPVVEIGKEAFKNCTSTKIVVMPDSVKRIGSHAFSQCGLREVNFPSNLTDIDEGAFMLCKYIFSLDIPDSVKRIGAYAFYGCSSLKKVKFPKDIKVFEKCVFDKCENFLYVDIPNGTEVIKSHAFNHQVNAHDRVTKHIRIPDSVSNIGRFAFGNFSGYTVIYCNMGSTALKFARDNDFKIMDYDRWREFL